MTVQEVLHRLDSLHPNAYSETEKIRWLSACEGHLYYSVFACHEHPPEKPQTLELSSLLLAEEPYHWLYHHYLEAQMLYAAGEVQGYNNAMSLYRALETDYWRFYHANHKPLGQAKSVLS